MDDDQALWAPEEIGEEPRLTRGKLVAAAAATFGGAMLVNVPAGVAAAPKKKLTGDAAAGIIRWDTAVLPTNVNPIGATNLPPVRRVGTWISNGLMRPTARPGIYAFDLARSFKAARDGSTWEFRLRPGVVWSDGSPFTSADVKASYEALLDRNYGSIWRSHAILIERVEAPDDLTVRFHMSKPGTWILNAYAQIPIVKAAEARNRDKLATNPIGTSAFLIQETRAGDRFVLARNGKYFRRGEPLSKGVNYVLAAEPSARIANLASGQTALTSDVAYNQVTLLAQRRVQLYDGARAPSRVYMYFNVNGEPFFRDVNFRNALSFAIDRQRIIDIVFAGKATPAQGQYSPNTLFYDPSIKRFGPRADVARAKQLLDRVQTKPNRPISMLLAGTDTLTSSTATILQANWRAIGVELQIEVLDLSAAVAKFVARNFDLFMVVDFLGTGPGSTPTYMFSSYDRGAIFNFADPNPQVERLVETARSGLDRQAVKQALSDLQRYDIEQQMTIAICHPHYLEAQGVPLSGYQPMPLGNLPFTVEDARIG